MRLTTRDRGLFQETTPMSPDSSTWKDKWCRKVRRWETFKDQSKRHRPPCLMKDHFGDAVHTRAGCREAQHRPPRPQPAGTAGARRPPGPQALPRGDPCPGPGAKALSERASTRPLAPLWRWELCGCVFQTHREACRRYFWESGASPPPPGHPAPCLLCGALCRA